MLQKRLPLNNFDTLYNQLNVEQKEAVDSIEGPVLVIAGPGTGKTQVLTMRIANILLKTDTTSSGILALTFTDSGTRAMRERLLSIIGPEAYYVNICTFHSFCSDILKNNPDKFVVAEDLEPLSDLERVQVFREIIDEEDLKVIKPFGSRYYYVKALIKTIQDLKREGVSPEDLAKFIKKAELDEKESEKLEEAVKVYKSYQKKIKEKNRYDFEDMISLVVERLKADEELLRDYQERYLYILVDEYQDTNSPQNKVVKLLASYWGEDANIFAVGDDAQSIYRFQGASIENILFFNNTFKNAKTIMLRKNYRSTKAIIDSSEDVISNNLVKLSDYIKGFEKVQEAVAKEDGEKIKVGHFSSGITESFFVAHKIKELITSGVSPSSIAVIYRNNADSKDFSDMLGRVSINFNLVGGENVLEDHDINKLLKLFDVILKVRYKDEDLDLFTVLNYEFLKFDYVDTLKLSRFASEKKLNFVEAINHTDFDKCGIKEPEKFKEFLNTLYKWQQADANSTLVSFFEKVLEESGFLNWTLESVDSIERLNRLNSLFAEIKKLNIADHSLNLAGFMQDISILKESNIPIYEEELNIRSNSVLLTTAHRAKGLEFDYVFIVKCFDGKWGNTRNRDLIKLPIGLVDSAMEIKSKENLDVEKNEDERRLFYVSMTRAKKEVFITYSGSYFTETSTKEAVPSMFISEIGEDKKQPLDISKYEKSVKEVLKDILKPVYIQNISVEEKDFLQGILRNFSLSVTALNTYLGCPYKFKLNTLLRTPRAKNKHMALGTAVHFALQSFFKSFKDMGKVPDVRYLISEFDAAIEKEVLTQSDYLESKRKGELILVSYYSYYKAEFVKPLETEKFFGYGFSKIYIDDISITGKVDKIELVDPKTKEVKVIDYKTGKPQTRNEIEGNTKYSDGDYKRQLVFYKLLAESDRFFKARYKVVDAELDFVEVDKNGKYSKHSFKITDAEIEELKKVIREVMGKIRSLEFPRTTDYNVCSNCDYRAHCWPNGIPYKGKPVS